MIGVITIFEHELEILKDNCIIDEAQKLAGKTFYRGELVSDDVVFVQVDNDAIDVAMTSQLLLDNYAVESLHYSGAARTLAPFVETGDIIIANYLVWPEQMGEFYRLSTQPQNRKSMIFEPSEEILKKIKSASNAISQDKSRTVFGTILRSGYYEPEDPRIQLLNREYGAIALDNAGPAFAYACAKNEIPYITYNIAIDDLDKSDTHEFRSKIRTSIEHIFNLKMASLVEIGGQAIPAR